MKPFLLALLATFALHAAPPFGQAMQTLPCSVCKGQGKLILHPPDHGQHKGAIEGMNHWDVRLACPICEGKKHRTLYRTTVPPNPATQDVQPCSACGWCGVDKCRKCLGSGLVKCANTPPRCESGWVVREVQQGKGHKKKVVEPCAVCQGLGRVVCPTCQGMGGTLCRKCHGLGRDVEKETRLREKAAREADLRREKERREAERLEKKIRK